MIDLMNEWLGRIVSHFCFHFSSVSHSGIYEYVFKPSSGFGTLIIIFCFYDISGGWISSSPQIIAVDVLYYVFQMKAFADLLAFIATISGITVIWKGNLPGAPL